MVGAPLSWLAPFFFSSVFTRGFVSLINLRHPEGESLRIYIYYRVRAQTTTYGPVLHAGGTTIPAVLAARISYNIALDKVAPFVFLSA